MTGARRGRRTRPGARGSPSTRPPATPSSASSSCTARTAAAAAPRTCWGWCSARWNDYEDGLATIRSEAAGTGYAGAVDRLEEDLARTGYLALVPEILEGAPIDVEMLVESTSADAGAGWPAFLDTAEDLLTDPGPPGS